MALQQLSKGRLSKETIVQGTFVQGTVVQGDFCPRKTFVQVTVLQGDFCPRKTFVQEDKYLYFCPRNFCYRNEEKNLKIAGNKKKLIQIFFYYSWNVGSVLLMDFCTPSPRLIWCKTIFNKAGWAAEQSGPEKRGTGSPIETKNMAQQPNHRANRNKKQIMWTRSAILYKTLGHHLSSLLGGFLAYDPHHGCISLC